MNTANASNDSLEQFVNQTFNLVNFADLKDFLKLRQKQCFLDAVSKWPIFQKSFEQWECKCSIFGQEQHGASQQLLVELRACLHLVKRNDDISEEDNVLISEWDSKSRNDTGKDIKKFGSTIELVCLLDQEMEALIHCLSNHLSSWDKFSIKLMQDVLEVVSFN